MNILIMTSDKYLPALRVFCHLFSKYWSSNQPVLVAGFSKPEFQLPEAWKFFSIGKQEDYPFHRWSDAFSIALERVQGEQVIVMLEDYWLIKGVDLEAVRMAYDYCRQFDYVARFDLTADRAYSGGAHFYANINRPSGGELRIVQSNPSEPYHMSLMAGVWNVKHLQRILRPGESPHDLELSGTPRLRALAHETIVLGYEKEWQPIRYTLGIRANSGPGTVLLNDMPPEDVEELKSWGYLDPWGIR
jgi:hypothetical protein